jgi:hypothetical protein
MDGDASGGLVTRWLHRPGSRHLLKEMMASVGNDDRLVNLSDGGHIENLGVFELLRRRCRYIITGDGEADPDLAMNGLATVIRYARLELGIYIELNTDALHLDEDRNSKRHAIVGTIHYPGGLDEQTEDVALPEIDSLLLKRWLEVPAVGPHVAVQVDRHPPAQGVGDSSRCECIHDRVESSDQISEHGSAYQRRCTIPQRPARDHRSARSDRAAGAPLLAKRVHLKRAQPEQGGHRRVQIGERGRPGRIARQG